MNSIDVQNELDLRGGIQSQKTVSTKSTSNFNIGAALCAAPNQPSPAKVSQKIQCVMAIDSTIVKEGELMKIGKRTGSMRTRYYILRDQALYIYSNKNQKMPSNMIFLKGTLINQIKPDKNTKHHGFCIYHESKNVKPKLYYHKNIEVVEDWVRLMKLESSNVTFDDKYIRGPKLGNGKFSTVY